MSGFFEMVQKPCPVDSSFYQIDAASIMAHIVSDGMDAFWFFFVDAFISYIGINLQILWEFPKRCHMDDGFCYQLLAT